MKVNEPVFITIIFITYNSGADDWNSRIVWVKLCNILGNNNIAHPI